MSRSELGYKGKLSKPFSGELCISTEVSVFNPINHRKLLPTFKLGSDMKCVPET